MTSLAAKKGATARRPRANEIFLCPLPILIDMMLMLLRTRAIWRDQVRFNFELFQLGVSTRVTGSQKSKQFTKVERYSSCYMR